MKITGVAPLQDGREDLLKAAYKSAKDCQRCELCKCRKNLVFGAGNPKADIMLVGEAPGENEDRDGKVFVGKADQLLTKILEAIKLTRDEVYITNILKCRPPSNRTPAPTEVRACFPFLQQQIDIIRPRFILCLGKIAATTLFNKDVSLTVLRRSQSKFGDAILLATYHPAALLRNPGWKRGCWEDVKQLRELYDAYPAIDNVTRCGINEGTASSGSTKAPIPLSLKGVYTSSYVESLRSRIGGECLHLPGVRAIIVNSRSEILLQRRTDLKCWGLPAGAVELDETAAEALRREVYEETKLLVHAAEPMALHSGPAQRFCYPNGDQVQGFAITFIVREWSGDPEADGQEGSDLKFWPIDSLPEDIVPIHAQTLRDYKEYSGRFMLSGR